jgi:hypothetical protein
MAFDYNSTTISDFELNASLYAKPAVNEIKMDLDIILYGCIFYILIFVIGTIGNILVIYVLMKDKELRTFTNYLLANLSIADLLVLFTCVPTGLHDLFARERWYLGKVMCYLIAFIENCMGYASILSIFFITLDRYYVICKPLSVKARMNASRTVKIIVFIWLVSIAINAPLIFLSEYNLSKFSDNVELEYRCDAKSRQTWSLYYIICVTFLFYVAIGAVLVYMFVKITSNLRRSTHFLVVSGTMREHRNSLNTILFHKEEPNNALAKLNSYSMENECETPKKSVRINAPADEDPIETPQQSRWKLQRISRTGSGSCYLEKYIKQRRQVIFMLVCVLCTFYMCLFPLKVWSLVIMFGSRFNWFFAWVGFKRYWYINVTMRIFFYLNSSINPILYNCLSLKFRISFKKLWIFKLCFPEAHANQNFDMSANTEKPKKPVKNLSPPL